MDNGALWRGAHLEEQEARAAPVLCLGRRPVARRPHVVITPWAAGYYIVTCTPCMALLWLTPAHTAESGIQGHMGDRRRRDPRYKAEGEQDVYVDQVLFGERRGTFVDIGCNDGIHGSNTYFLAQVRGWAEDSGNSSRHTSEMRKLATELAAAIDKYAPQE